jgi:hypothetical protein
MMKNPDKNPGRTGFFAIGPDGGELYYIDLNRLTNSARVLDAILEISEKAWSSNALVGSLLKKIDTILQLQRNYCKDGVDQGDKSPKEIRDLVAINEKMMTDEAR